MLVTGVAKTDEVAALAREAQAIHTAFFILPSSGVSQAVYALLCTAPQYAAARALVTARTEVLDEVPGSIATVDLPSLLSRGDDPPIAFVRTHEEAFAGLIAPPTAEQTAAAVTPAWQPWPGPAKQTIQQAGGVTSVSAGRAGTDWMMITDPIPVRPESQYLVTSDLEISDGRVALYVLPGDSPAPMSAFYRHVAQDWTSEKFVVFTGKQSSVRVLVTAYNIYNPAAVSFRVRHLTVRPVTIDR